MKLNTLIILSLLLTLNCNSTKAVQNNAKMTTDKPVVIAKGNLHGSGDEGIEKQNLVISNTDDWKGLIEQMNTVNNVSSSFSETEIDFDKYTVIAIFAEVKGSGGHTIELDISTTSEQKLVTITHNAPSGMATSVMTQPYYIVKIPRTELPIVFK